MAEIIYQVTQGCTFCNTCVLECPAQAISMTEQGARINPAKCRGCGICAENCASEAIQPVKAEGK